MKSLFSTLWVTPRRNLSERKNEKILSTLRFFFWEKEFHSKTCKGLSVTDTHSGGKGVSTLGKFSNFRDFFKCKSSNPQQKINIFGAKQKISNFELYY